MMSSKTRTKLKMVILAQLLLGSCWGWSCSADMRDALVAGAMDYVTGNTTLALTHVWTAEDLFVEEEANEQFHRIAEYVVRRKV